MFSTFLSGSRVDASCSSASAIPANRVFGGGILGHPLVFEQNRGQTDSRVAYLARTKRATVFFTATEAIWQLDSSTALRMHASGTMHAKPAGIAPVGMKTHYSMGMEPERWHHDVPAYERVAYRDSDRGVSLVFHGNSNAVEYDFVVEPQGDTSAIVFGFEGQDAVRIDHRGNLIVTIGAQQIVHHQPRAYQMVAGHRRTVGARYVERGNGEIGFALSGYDRTIPLVIDPVVSTASYFGGSANDSANTIAVDASGNVYVAGETSSLNFPATSGAVQSRNRGNQDAFVAKLDPAGHALFVTYLGGAGIDIANAVAVDSAGNAYVAGETTSPDFPVTAGALQPRFAGATDGFLAKLSPSGSVLTYSTYLGGRGFDRVNGVAVDAGGSAYLAGRTGSDDFPVTPGAFQTSYRGSDFDAYAAKVNPSGSALTWATYLGGFDNDAGFGVAAGPAGSCYVVGGTRSPDFPVTSSGYQTSNLSTDGFLVKLDAAGSSLLYSTFLGGSFVDRVNAVAVDASGVAYLTGWTNSSDFPLSGALQPYGGGSNDAFVAAIDPSRSRSASLLFSTFFGGRGDDRGFGISIASDGGTLVTGQTGSPNLPVIAPLQPAYGGGAQDAFVLRLRPATHTVEYASWLGGSGDDGGSGIAGSASGDVWMTGGTNSANFPTKDAAQPALGGGSDAFIAKISAAAPELVPSASHSILVLLAAALAAAGMRLHPR